MKGKIIMENKSITELQQILDNVVKSSNLKLVINEDKINEVMQQLNEVK
jgi:hypothetical protein